MRGPTTAAALCWVLALVGNLFHPHAPERLVVARGLHTLARHLRADTTDLRTEAEAALHRARHHPHLGGSATPAPGAGELLRQALNACEQACAGLEAHKDGDSAARHRVSSRLVALAGARNLAVGEPWAGPLPLERHRPGHG